MPRLGILALALALAWPAAAGAQHLGPHGAWLQYRTPEDAGYASDALEEAYRFADRVGSGAVVAVAGGAVVAAWGDVDREFRAHSVRKSLYSALVGIAVERGLLDLEATLAELGIDDVEPLTAEEKRARVVDLIAARSGVYLPAAYSPASIEEELPERGSHPPGTHWLYNNWDFNVASVVLEQVAGRGLYELFEGWIAGPLGMRDWEPADGFAVYEPTRSRHPAYTFRISARDLARFGHLYLRDGRWGDAEVVPAGWVERSTRAVSELPGEGRGYGYMWWTYAAGSLPDRYVHVNRHDIVLARGSGGQGVFVIPDADLVVVHRGDTDTGEGVDGPDAWAIVERILAAREGPARPDPELLELAPRPFSDRPPEPEPGRLVEPDPADIEGALGCYRYAPSATGAVFRWAGRPFIHVPGEGDGELFGLADGTFTLKVVSGVTIEFETDDAGRATAVTLSLGPRTMRAERVADTACDPPPPAP